MQFQGHPPTRSQRVSADEIGVNSSFTQLQSFGSGTYHRHHLIRGNGVPPISFFIRTQQCGIGSPVVQDMMDEMSEGADGVDCISRGILCDGLSHPPILLVGNFKYRKICCDDSFQRGATRYDASVAKESDISHDKLFRAGCWYLFFYYE